MEKRRRSTPDDAIQKETETENSGDRVPKEDNEVQFVSKTGHSDLTLKVDGHKIQVVKAVLCVASPVFAAMFEGKFEESRQREIELPDKTFGDFVEFLRCLYPDKLEPVTTENMYRILPYAIEYQVDVLEKRSRRLIVETLRKNHTDNENEIYRHLQLAELYSLEELKNKAISLASELSLQQMERGSEKYPASDKTITEIHTLALKRHELNTSDDMHVFRTRRTYVTCNPGKTEKGFLVGSQTQVGALQFLGEQILQTSSCEEILRALRLSFRYFPSDSEKRNKLLLKLCTETEGCITKCGNEIKLLPDKLKQYLETVCCTQQCSNFKEWLK